MHDLSLFLDSSCFTDFVSEVIELGSANFTATSYFKFCNVWRVERKGSLNADSATDFAEGDVFGDSTVFDCDYGSFKNLDSLFTAFANFNVGFDGVAGEDLGEIGLHVGFAYAF